MLRYMVYSFNGTRASYTRLAAWPEDLAFCHVKAAAEPPGRILCTSSTIADLEVHYVAIVMQAVGEEASHRTCLLHLVIGG